MNQAMILNNPPATGSINTTVTSRTIEEMHTLFGAEYIGEISENFKVLYPQAQLTHYRIGTLGNNVPLIGITVSGDATVMWWNPRVYMTQAFGLQAKLLMEMVVNGEEKLLSVLVPALDKPLSSSESWSMGTLEWEGGHDAYLVSYMRLISETAARCVERIWVNEH